MGGEQQHLQELHRPPGSFMDVVQEVSQFLKRLQSTEMLGQWCGKYSTYDIAFKNQK